MLLWFCSMRVVIGLDLLWHALTLLFTCFTISWLTYHQLTGWTSLDTIRWLLIDSSSTTLWHQSTELNAGSAANLPVSVTEDISYPSPYSSRCFSLHISSPCSIRRNALSSKAFGIIPCNSGCMPQHKTSIYMRKVWCLNVWLLVEPPVKRRAWRWPPLRYVPVWSSGDAESVEEFIDGRWSWVHVWGGTLERIGEEVLCAQFCSIWSHFACKNTCKSYSPFATLRIWFLVVSDSLITCLHSRGVEQPPLAASVMLIWA